MQFIIVVASVALLALIIWLISRSVRVFPFGKSNRENPNQSHEQVHALDADNETAHTHGIEYDPESYEDYGDYEDDSDQHSESSQFADYEQYQDHDQGEYTLENDEYLNQDEQWEQDHQDEDLHSDEELNQDEELHQDEDLHSQHDTDDDYGEDQNDVLESQDDDSQYQWPDHSESPEEREPIVGEIDGVVTPDIHIDEDQTAQIAQSHNKEFPVLVSSHQFSDRSPIHQPLAADTYRKDYETDSEPSQLIQTSLNVDINFPDYRGSSDIEIEAIGWLQEKSGPSSRVDIVAIYKSLGVATSNPHSIWGFSVDSGKWCNVLQDTETTGYSDLVCTLQMVHHGVTLTERDWWQFTKMVEDFAAALSRDFLLSFDTNNVFDYAADLRDRINGLDLQAVLILQLSDQISLSDQSMSYIAREFDLTKRAATAIFDRFEQTESDPVYIYSIVPMSVTDNNTSDDAEHEVEVHKVIMVCNLSTSPSPQNAFLQMADLGMELADRLNAILVDQDGHEVTTRSIAQLGSYIHDYTNELIEVGITPGGVVAKQLFDVELSYRQLANYHDSLSAETVQSEV